MSARPIEAKQRRKAARALRRDVLPAYFDVVQWLIDNRHAKTKREAREIVLAGRVKADSHAVGFDTFPILKKDKAGKESIEYTRQVRPHVPVKLKKDLVVLRSAEDATVNA